MNYSIVDTEKAKAYGFRPELHQLTLNGTKMVLNENELFLVDSNTQQAAETLGGTLLSHGEVINELKKINPEDYE